MSQNNWDEIWNKAKEVGKAVGDVAGEVVDASRQKIDELKKRRELQDCYLELGHLYYELLQEIHMVACPHCNNLVQSDAMFCS